MTNTNRSKGDYLERSTRAALEQHSWFVIRAAGSHGVADLVALRAGFMPLLISCKTNGKIPRTERAALIATAADTEAMPVLAYRTTRGYVDLAIVTEDDLAAWDQLRVPKATPKPKTDEGTDS